MKCEIELETDPVFFFRCLGVTSVGFSPKSQTAMLNYQELPRKSFFVIFEIIAVVQVYIIDKVELMCCTYISPEYTDIFNVISINHFKQDVYRSIYHLLF